MTITAIYGCKNEQDIVEPWVRHTLKFCDRIIISDNSLDDSRQILEKLSDEFPDRVIVEYENWFAFDQKSTMTSLFRLAAKGWADYVVPLDTDEFISAPSREIFKKHLESIPAGGVGTTPWRTYVSTYIHDEALRGMMYRRKAENPEYVKCIIHCAGFSPDDFVIEMGNHEVLSPNGRRVPIVRLDLPLLHFPVRSPDQFAIRIIVNWMAQLTRDPSIATSGKATHTRNLFKLLCQNGIRRETLFTESMGYAQGGTGPFSEKDIVHDDPQLDLTRKYSTGKAMPALRLLAREWEKSLTGGK